MWLSLVLVLLITNAVTLGVLRRVWREHGAEMPYDRTVAQALAAQQSAGPARVRRVLTIEVLNPVQLVGQRGGRMVGLGALFVPGLTHRVVHEQMLRTIRKQMAAEGVVADVRLQRIDPAPSGTSAPSVMSPVLPADGPAPAPAPVASAPVTPAPSPAVSTHVEDPYPFFKDAAALFGDYPSDWRR